MAIESASCIDEAVDAQWKGALTRRIILAITSCIATLLTISSSLAVSSLRVVAVRVVVVAIGAPLVHRQASSTGQGGGRNDVGEVRSYPYPYNTHRLAIGDA